MLGYRHLLTPNWVGVFAGLYLATVPVLFAFPTTGLIIGFHIGAAVLIAGIAAASVVSRNPDIGMINVPLGLFMLGLPLLLGYAAFTPVLVQSIAIGALVAVTAVVAEFTKAWTLGEMTAETRDIVRDDVRHVRPGRKAA